MNQIYFWGKFAWNFKRKLKLIRKYFIQHLLSQDNVQSVFGVPLLLLLPLSTPFLIPLKKSSIFNIRNRSHDTRFQTDFFSSSYQQNPSKADNFFARESIYGLYTLYTFYCFYFLISKAFHTDFKINYYIIYEFMFTITITFTLMF